MPVGTKNKQSVLLIGNYRPTIPLSRELSAKNFNVIVGVTDAPERGYEYSRRVSEMWEHVNQEERPTIFLEELNQFVASRDDIIAVIPVAEDTLVLINENRDKLIKPELFALAEKNHISTCIDKSKSIQFVATTDVDQAPFEFAHNLTELKTACKTIGYPIVLRPICTTNQFGTNKALLCHDEKNLEEHLPKWPKGHAKIIVQKLFRGRRHNIYFAAEKGEIKRALQCVAFRTDRIDGTGMQTTGEILSLNSKLLKDTQTLVSKMNYSSVGCAQFMVDEKTGKTTFIELNPRIAGSHALPEGERLELGIALVNLVQGRPVSTIPGGKPGNIYAWTYGDLGGLTREIRAGRITIREAVKWFGTALYYAFRAERHVTWSWRDPKPTLAAYAIKASKLLRKPFERAPKTEIIAPSKNLGAQ